MNAAGILLFGIAWFIFAYFWYGGIIKNKLVKSDDSNITPSMKINDGADYVPAKTPILFGHHFSSIAGAGPIVGPILAFAWFGWLPAIIWILIGSVFMGAVHDYTSLMVSVRNKGKSIVDIAGKAVSPKARAIFSIFVWLTLVLVQAVFADLTKKTFLDKPGIVIPTFGILVIAALFGYFVYRKGVNTFLATVVSLALLFLLIEFGGQVEVNIQSGLFWICVALGYSFIASVLPVWLLLQPRDYLSMYILIIGLFLAFAGIIAIRPELNAPAFTGFSSAKGPLFPILFITIACGAISGFHSIVSSGTTAKQLRKESDGRKIAFGGMLTEGFLALLVVLLIGSLLTWGGSGEFSFQGILGEGGATVVFGAAFGLAAEALYIPREWGMSFGILMLNAFILTTLDTSTRLNRYIVQETLGEKFGGIFKNKYFATASSLALAFLILVFGDYKVIWPVFGAANQLIGALALFVVSAYFLGFKAPRLYTFIPACIMLAFTESALFYNAFWNHIPNQEWLLAVISVVLFSLGIVVAWESVSQMRRISKSGISAGRAIGKGALPDK